MPAIPRIVRAAHQGPIVRPAQGIPVIARVHWLHGVDQEIAATAMAWTSDAVEVNWELEAGEGLRSDWIPAVDVTRRGQKLKQVDLPPHTNAGEPRARW